MFTPPEGSWVSNYIDDLKSRARSWLKVIDQQGLSKQDAAGPQPADESLLPPVGQVAQRIGSMLSVGFGKTDRIIRLSVTAMDPLVAAVVVNAVADAYLSYLVETRVSQTERAGQWLAEKIEESKEPADHARRMSCASTSCATRFSTFRP